MAETPRVVLLMAPFAGFDQGLLEGISRYTQLHEPWVLCRANDYLEVPLAATESISGRMPGQLYSATGTTPFGLSDLRRLRATGVIGRILTASLARKLLAAGVPAIGIDLPGSEDEEPFVRISQIRTQSHKVGQMAAEHFLERGFRHFAFCGFAQRDWSQRREEGYRQRLAEAGFACDVYQPKSPRRRLSWQEERPAVLSWLQSLPKPAAVMACNDDRGRQLLEAALLGGLTVPDDVAVLGVDDDHVVCNLSNPPLSSVAFGLEQAGYQAAQALSGLMAGTIRKAQRIPVDPLWVVSRRSTDVVATEDRHVGIALRFIRDQIRRSIGVSDIVAASGISRRNLEIRFRRVLGRSIRGEIQRMRLIYTRQLLLDTRLPAGRIAELAGFGSLAYLSSVFHRAMGVTLAEYRRRLRNR